MLSASKNRDRKASIMKDSPMHSDAQKGFDAIIALGQDAYNLQMGIVIQAELNEEDAENYLDGARIDGEDEKRDQNGKDTSCRP